MKTNLTNLHIDGEVICDSLHKTLYSTDASAYREIPLGVAFPKNNADIYKIVEYASSNQITLIPRAAGTSLAGQVVGNGLVVDIFKYMNNILEINANEKWICVQPGVVLDELNIYCKPYGLFFAPETSTSNRCCIGGMVGNNSCGSHSLVYGSTRDHLLEANVVLSDGSEITLRALEDSEIEQKLKLDSLEGSIYRGIFQILSDKDNQNEILENFPDVLLRRRNSGYAIDELLRTSYFDKSYTEKFNLCKLLAGSEGTLAFITEVKLNLVPLPPKEKAVICVHCNTLEESFEANLIALKHHPVAIELMDGKILELSKQNITQNKNRFFLKNDPVAILIIELAEDTIDLVNNKAETIIADLKAHNMGYHYPIVYDISKVWELRKAGLGLLSGMQGDSKPVSVIEDTAVMPHRLPAYIADFKIMMAKYGLDCVYHAHISTGELHLRPILNLKDNNDRKLFRIVATESAKLVKKYKGSLSGEHGDGRLRGEFIPLLLGEKNYQILKGIKKIWDPNNIFNAGKIVDTPPMDINLRYEDKKFEVNTYFDYTKQQGWLRAIEQCNGSGDCRKSEQFGGIMCPSFRATRDEKNSTRARANTLREFLLNPTSKDVFNQKEILEVLDTCISCKACKSECPSNVDMTRFKAEYLQHHYSAVGIPFRSFLISNISNVQKIGMLFPSLYNGIVSNVFTSSIIKKVIRFAPQRTIPKLYKMTLVSWYKKNVKNIDNPKGNIFMFADEFTNYMDVKSGIAFIQLLNKLGYNVEIPKHIDSGRAEMSKGFLKVAKKKAQQNVILLKDIVNSNKPLVGIEPSSILSFRDEYPDLVGSELKEDALALSKNVFLYDEFIVGEIEKGNICKEQFTEDHINIKLHGHCHQKSLASIELSKTMLSLPKNYNVDIIQASCCGLAGSFGYEKEHYDLSMQIGNITLFPAINKALKETIISAPGTSCRHQIKDGTGRDSYHPIELMYNALKQ